MNSLLISLLLLGVVLGSGCIKTDNCEKDSYFDDLKFDESEYVEFTNGKKWFRVNITHPAHRDIFHPDKKVFIYTLVHCGCSIPDRYDNIVIMFLLVKRRE